MTTPVSPSPRVVAVTGASGYIGERIVERLLAEPSIERVIGIDIRRSPIEHEKLTSIVRDVTDPLDTLFRRTRVDTVVHLAFVLRQLRDREASHRVNIGGASNVLWACEAAGVSRIILMSSSTVYGPHPDNEELLIEDAPLRPPPEFDYANDKVTVEWFYRNYGEQRRRTQVSILRGSIVMGPMVDNFITQALNKPMLIAVGRDDPEMQFVHEEDLTEILWRFVSESHPGTFNVAGPGTIAWSDVVKMAHKRLLRFSAPVAYGITNLTWRLRLQNDAPGVGLDYIRWPWTVNTARIEKELNFKFKHTSRDAVESYLGEPPPAPAPVPDPTPAPAPEPTPAPEDAKDPLDP
jgi:UDP-glucose 4-epimerase